MQSGGDCRCFALRAFALRLDPAGAALGMVSCPPFLCACLNRNSAADIHKAAHPFRYDRRNCRVVAAFAESCGYHQVVDRNADGDAQACVYFSLNEISISSSGLNNCERIFS